MSVLLSSPAINSALLRDNIRQLKSGLIAPSREKVTDDTLEDHAADPIKSINDIMLISRYLISNCRYRDNMLFIVGINFGLRVSDLRMLRFCNIINDNLTFKDTFPVFEKKTRNTRKKKKNRYITVNTAVMEAVTLYLEHTEDVHLSDYMFRSISNNGYKNNEPISARSVERLLKSIAADLRLPMHLSTHSLRKTFCYHQMLMSHNDPRKLMLLQKILGHSTAAQTLDYIGITGEEIEEAYRTLNLGSIDHNYMDAVTITEEEEETA